MSMVTRSKMITPHHPVSVSSPTQIFKKRFILQTFVVQSTSCMTAVRDSKCLHTFEKKTTSKKKTKAWSM